MNSTNKASPRVWLIMNSIFLALLLGAINTGSLIFIVLVNVLVWIVSIGAIVSKVYTGLALTNTKLLDSEKPLTYKQPPVPSSISILFDLVTLALLVYGGWTVLSILYAIHCALIPFIYKDLKTLKERNLIN